MDTKPKRRDILITLTATTGTGLGPDSRFDAAIAAFDLPALALAGRLADLHHRAASEAARRESEKLALEYLRQARLDSILERYMETFEEIAELIKKTLTSLKLLFEVGPLKGWGGAVIFQSSHEPTTHTNSPTPGPGRRAREPPTNYKVCYNGRKEESHENKNQQAPISRARVLPRAGRRRHLYYSTLVPQPSAPDRIARPRHKQPATKRKF